MNRSFAVILLLSTTMGAARSSPGPLQQQTSHGVTIKILKVGWATHTAIAHDHGFWNGPLTPRLAIWYSVKAPGLKFTPGIDVRDVSAQPLDTSPTYSASLKSEKDGTVEMVEWCGGIHPGHSAITAHFEWLDPRAPAGADGRLTEHIVLQGLPLPHLMNQPEPLKVSQTTPHGLEIGAFQIRLVRTKPSPPMASVVVRHRVTPGSAITNAWLFPEDSGGIVDSTGKDLGGPGCETLTTPSPDPHQWTITEYRTSPMPSPGAKTLTLRLYADETVPSLRQPQWNYQMDFLVSLPQNASTPPATTPHVSTHRS